MADTDTQGVDTLLGYSFLLSLYKCPPHTQDIGELSASQSTFHFVDSCPSRDSIYLKTLSLLSLTHTLVADFTGCLCNPTYPTAVGSSSSLAPWLFTWGRQGEEALLDTGKHSLH